jgi:prevent-host-death family protein
VVNQIGVRELNQQTSRIIERVKRGETLEITKRGQPVARLVPATPAPVPVPVPVPELLERMIREGTVVPPTNRGPIPMPVHGDPNVDVTAGLIQMREEERW